METYYLKNDISLLCLEATSFPEGISDAFVQLYERLSLKNDRKLYGISHGSENGKIIYRVAVEQVTEDEVPLHPIEKFVLKKGEYIGTRINDYPEHMESIGKTFGKLLTHPRLDLTGCCVEVYLNEKDVQCMVRLNAN